VTILLKTLNEIIDFMARLKIPRCRKYPCEQPPFMDGLGKQHSVKDEAKRIRRDSALQALHRGVIDEEYIGAGPMREELERIRKWWHQICDAVIAQRQHAILKDETEHASEWCIWIAQELVDAERERRVGKEGDNLTRQYIGRVGWERFENMKRGLNEQRCRTAR
jgi:hypothetical protein